MMAIPHRRMIAPALVLLGFLAPQPAHSSDPQRGVAAVYDAKRFAGRPMASGMRFDPRANHAAHRHLPFGTVVRVTNLRNGASTTVVITDRGPFTRGRIIDLSPRSAREIGMGVGLAQVELTPLLEVAEAR